MSRGAAKGWSSVPTGLLTTGVGSLPHHNVDAALEHSFRMRLPFLPQIPVRNPREFMIRQALDGMPGLEAGERGEVFLKLDVWEKEASFLNKKLDESFGGTSFDWFLPSSDTYSAWQPFLFELQERNIKAAKIQLAGPMTCQWALRLQDGTPADRKPEIAMQIFRLVLARSISMVRELKSRKVECIFFWDEPGFYGFSKTVPRHLLGLQELKLSLESLRKEGAVVGIHCCSNTDWGAVFSLGMDVLSIDCELSLAGMLNFKREARAFLDRGGRFSFGVVPTAKGAEDIARFNAGEAFHSVVNFLEQLGFTKTAEKRAVMEKSLVSAACGLALHRSEDAEKVVELLSQFSKEMTSLPALPV